MQVICLHMWSIQIVFCNNRYLLKFRSIVIHLFICRLQTKWSMENIKQSLRNGKQRDVDRNTSSLSQNMTQMLISALAVQKSLYVVFFTTRYKVYVRFVQGFLYEMDICLSVWQNLNKLRLYSNLTDVTSVMCTCMYCCSFFSLSYISICFIGLHLLKKRCYLELFFILYVFYCTFSHIYAVQGVSIYFRKIFYC